MYLILIVILGLLAGSFITAWSWRLHSGQSIARGRSECPNCHHTLGTLDLIPLASWLVQGRKCRYCHKPISTRYPVIELVTGTLFALSYLSYAGSGKVWWELAVWLLLVIGMLTIAIFDFEWMLVPMPVVYMTLGLATIRLLLLMLNGQAVFLNIIAALLCGGFFWGLFKISNERWMGEGDAYLGLILGLVLGLGKSWVALFIAFNSAAIVSLLLMALKLRSRKDMVPFGPFLMSATIMAYLYGQSIIDWYQRTFL